MAIRGFARGYVATAASVFALMLAGSAVCSSASAADWGSGSPNWSGSYLGLKAAYDSLQVTYTNTGTPGQGLNGAMIGLAGGSDVQWNNFVVGLAGDATFGNLTAFVRDGNYITESGKINFLADLRARAGFAIGGFLPYVTGGVEVTSLEQGEVCPSPAAAPFGFCSTHGPFDLKGSKTLVGGTVGGGVDVMMGGGWSLQAQYLHTFFANATYVLGPDATNTPLPPSEAHPSLDEGSLSFLKHF